MGAVYFLSTDGKPGEFSFHAFAKRLTRVENDPWEMPYTLHQVFSMYRAANVAFIAVEILSKAEMDRDTNSLVTLLSHKKPEHDEEQAATVYRVHGFALRRCCRQSDSCIKIPFSVNPDDASSADRTNVDKEYFKRLASDEKLDYLGYVDLFVVFRIIETSGARKKIRVKGPLITGAIIREPTPGSNQQYIHSRAAFRVKLLDHEFSVVGSYFAQQDHVQSSCAHAALKVALRNIFCALGEHESGQDDFHFINEIVGIKRNPARVRADALSVDEIRKVFDAAGFHADVYDCQFLNGENPGLQTLKKCYYSIETGLPAILAFTGAMEPHAMAVVGHTFDGNLWLAQHVNAYFRTHWNEYLPSHTWIDKLVVQDDNFGPYCNIDLDTLSGWNPVVVLPRFRWDQPRVERRLSQAQKVPNDGENLLDEYGENWQSGPDLVEQQALAVLKDFEWLPDGTNYYQDLGNDSVWKTLESNRYFNRLLNALRNGNIVMRTIPCTREMYAKFLEAECVDATTLGADGSPEELHEFCLSLLPSKPFWLVEVSIPHLYQRTHRRLGEIIVELTKVNGQQSLQANLVRLPGVLSIRKDGSSRHYPSRATHHYPIATLLNDDFCSLLKQTYRV